jgi:hypothetical protein
MHTFWEQARVAGLCVLPQKPAIAKVVVALNELDAVAAGKSELVGGARQEFVCKATSQQVVLSSMRAEAAIFAKAGPARTGARTVSNLRTTTRRSPGAAMVSSLREGKVGGGINDYERQTEEEGDGD